MVDVIHKHHTGFYVGFEYSIITPKLYVGSMITTKYDIDHLVEQGVTHIINACHEHNYQNLMTLYPPATQIKYLWNPERDDGILPKPDGWFHKAMKFAEDADRLYVHCIAGLNRSTSLAYAILRNQGVSKEQTIKIMETNRPIIVEQGGMYYRDCAERAVETYKGS